ncbi:hypothetical protein QEH59_18665 [Coraliomargarita sp. SDUM461004]|uniref:Uncharacterized protein n=1 Tax=Thalassobacterium sedimentorum TaxID=3041258 RepID=A0ABU1AP59_9BACT|nr:hypothetical protein [Coraliomargarita sp. SDUM461004]MDQ8196459.1 hypothetical protein [Coraliomargarita sp. SDUM461004]
MKLTKIDHDAAQDIMKLSLEGSSRAFYSFMSELSDQISKLESECHERKYERRKKRIESILSRQDSHENRALLRDLIEVLEVFEETGPSDAASILTSSLAKTQKPFWESVKGEFCYITNPEVLRS